MLRAVATEGPQTITRHGEEVAVVIDMATYRRLTAPSDRLTKLLLGPPQLDEGMATVWDEIEAERKTDFPREIFDGFHR